MNDDWKNFEGYARTENKTQLISVVMEFQNSFDELKNSSDMFGPHSLKEKYIKSGPLRECRTLHLGSNPLHRNLLSNDDQFEILNYKLPETLKFLNLLKRIIDPDDQRKVSKSYITILQPGKQIYAHCDTDGEYWNQIDRFQFYYSGNNKVSQFINGTLYDINPGYFYLFDHRQIHQYKNNSQEDVYLMVFDLFTL